jgi:hypothetical protein
MNLVFRRLYFLFSVYFNVHIHVRKVLLAWDLGL